MKVIPSGQSLGATIEGLDLSKSIPIERLFEALGKHGVLRFPRQQLTAMQLRAS